VGATGCFRAWSRLSLKRRLASLGARARRAGKSLEAVQADRKSAGWKVAIAAELKAGTQASSGWIAEQLHMGSAVAVSQCVSQARRPSAERKEPD
jgi:hypothetical protein